MITELENKLAILEQENNLLREIFSQSINKLIELECKIESIVEILDINDIVDREMIESIYDHIKQETDFKNTSVLNTY